MTKYSGKLRLPSFSADTHNISPLGNIADYPRKIFTSNLGNTHKLSYAERIIN